MLPARDIVVVHSSDLHMDHDYTARLHGGDGTAGLASVLSAACAAGADIVVLAGDTFDCHRVPPVLLDRAAALISAATLPVVLLPGNHDPAVADAVYHHQALARLDNLHVLGVTHEEAVVFADIDLEVWGRAHRDYGDMMPFERLRPRSTRWQIAVAHASVSTLRRVSLSFAPFLPCCIKLGGLQGLEARSTSRALCRSRAIADRF